KQKRHSIRSKSAANAERNPHRHPGSHHARNERSGNGSHRRLDCGRTGSYWGRNRAEARSAGSGNIVRKIPVVLAKAIVNSKIGSCFIEKFPMKQFPILEFTILRAFLWLIPYCFEFGFDSFL